jgi:hypothetical protein
MCVLLLCIVIDNALCALLSVALLCSYASRLMHILHSSLLFQQEFYLISFMIVVPVGEG